MERTNKGPAGAVPLMTGAQLEAFYATEYPKLVKILVLLDATVEEAEDAVQNAMADLIKRSRAGQAPDYPAGYVRMAAFRFFIKERQRGRERLQREIRGGHLVLEVHLDDRLDTMEDERYIKYLLGCLTSTQRKVIRLVMDGLSTHEIAEALSKSGDDVRQHLKNARDRLELHPDIAPLTPGHGPAPDKEPRRRSQRRSRERRRSSE